MKIFDAEKASCDAISSAATYMAHAVTHIDAQFGDGYARAHPDLVVGFMRAAAADYAASQQLALFYAEHSGG